jgi:hypothetical protein
MMVKSVGGRHSMFTVLISISVSLFFLLFFGVMILGNRVAHVIEYQQAKEAEEKLTKIEQMMQQNKERTEKRNKK